jgi:hypothetical protein
VGWMPDTSLCSVLQNFHSHAPVITDSTKVGLIPSRVMRGAPHLIVSTRISLAPIWRKIEIEKGAILTRS